MIDWRYDTENMPFELCLAWISGRHLKCAITVLRSGNCATDSYGCTWSVSKDIKAWCPINAPEYQP